MHDPRAHPDHSPARQSSPAHCRALGRHDTFERQAERRVQTPGFLDARVEVGESARLFEWDRSGEGGGMPKGVELGEQTGKGRGVGEEAVDRGAEEDGGRVTTGGDVGGCPRCEGPRWKVISFCPFVGMGARNRIEGWMRTTRYQGGMDLSLD